MSGEIRLRYDRRVETKFAWGDAWVEVPYLEPKRCTWTAVPEVARAELKYDFGDSILREGLSPPFLSYPPLALNNYYVRIGTKRRDLPDVPASWTWWFFGTFLFDSKYLRGFAKLKGKQTLTACSVLHFLDRAPLEYAYALEGGAAVRVDHLPTFNKRGKRGTALLGNRSAELGPDGVYLFSREGAVWKTSEIVHYLLKYHAPAGITYKAVEQVDALDQAEREWDLSSRTLLQALGELANPKHGVACWPTIGDVGDEESPEEGIRLVFRTMTETAITYAGKTLPANTNQISIVLPSGTDEQVADDLEIRHVVAGEVDALELVSERVRATLTFSHADRTLDQGWTDEPIAREYIGGDSSFSGGSSGGVDEATRLDLYRTAEKFQRAFNTFVVPADWDWLAGNGLGQASSGDLSIVALMPLDDGGFASDQVGPFVNAFHLFQRETPFRIGRRYDLSPVEDESADDLDEQFRAPLCAIFDGVSGAHPRTERWHLVDKLAQSIGCVDSCHVHLLDKELGFQLISHPRHLFANFGDAANMETNFPPEFDWRLMVFTATVELDVRQRIVIDDLPSTPHETRRVKRIALPNCHYWFAVPETVVDVDPDGNLRTIHADNLILRNDVDKLQYQAAFLRAWFGVVRKCVSVPFRELEWNIPLGALAIDIQNSGWTDPVNTVVSAIDVDFENEKVVFETGFGNVDYISPLMTETPGEIGEVKRRLTEAEVLAANHAIRLGIGAGGGECYGGVDDESDTDDTDDSETDDSGTDDTGTDDTGTDDTGTGDSDDDTGTGSSGSGSGSDSGPSASASASGSVSGTAETSGTSSGFSGSSSGSSSSVSSAIPDCATQTPCGCCYQWLGGEWVDQTGATQCGDSEACPGVLTCGATSPPFFDGDYEGECFCGACPDDPGGL